MKPYRNIKLTECPDVVDIRVEGRRSRVGRRDARTYIGGRARRAMRRALKKADRRLEVAYA